MKSWSRLEVNDLPLVWQYISKALERGLENYNYNLIECLWIGGSNSTLLFKTVDDVLCVSRHACYGVRTNKLLFPPISLSGDEEKEVQVMRDLLRMGTTARVPKSYAIKHNLDHSNESQWSGGHEIIYTKEALNLKGKSYATERAECNKLKRFISEGKIEVVENAPLKELLPLSSRWKKQRGYEEGLFDLIWKEKEVLKPHLNNFSLRYEGKIIYTSLLLSLSKGVLISPCAMTDFSSSPLSSLQKATKILLLESDPSLTKIIEGGYDSEGVKNSKKAIPHKVNKQVRLVSPKKLSKEEWDNLKPPTANFFGI